MFLSLGEIRKIREACHEITCEIKASPEFLERMKGMVGDKPLDRSQEKPYERMGEPFCHWRCPSCKGPATSWGSPGFTVTCRYCQVEEELSAPRPPLGLMPRWRWLELRQAEVIAAMHRCTEANQQVPQNLFRELTWVRDQLGAAAKP